MKKQNELEELVKINKELAQLVDEFFAKKENEFTNIGTPRITAKLGQVMAVVEKLN